MGKCENCGFMYDNNNAKFCPKCGNELIKKIVCDKCKKIVPQNSIIPGRTLGLLIILFVVIIFSASITFYNMCPLTDRSVNKIIRDCAANTISENTGHETKDLFIYSNDGFDIYEIPNPFSESIWDCTSKEYNVLVLYEYNDNIHEAEFRISGTRFKYSCTLEKLDNETLAEINEREMEQNAELSAWALSPAESNQDDSNESENSEEKATENAQNKSEAEEVTEKTLLEMMIDDVDKIYLADKYNMELLSEEELEILSCSILAKHGYIFKNNDMTNYFIFTDFYEPSIYPEEWDDSLLSDIEIQNRDLILEVIQGYDEARR